jgi:hypothetical protein
MMLMITINHKFCFFQLNAFLKNINRFNLSESNMIESLMNLSNNEDILFLF